MNTTKSFIYSLLLLLCLTTITSAQFYLKLGAGYGILPINGFKFYEKSSLVGNEFYAYDTTQTPIEKSWGTGFQPAFGIGYVLTKNIAMELNGSYLSGTTLEPELTDRTQKFSSSGIYINPALKLQAPLKNITPYTRIGLLIGLPEIKQEETNNMKTGAYKRTIRGGIAMGIESALGMEIKLSTKLNTYFELFGTSLNWKPSEYEITENYTNEATGVIEYTERLQPYERFSTIGAKVGVSYILGKAPKK
ncbi:MAG: hypothetical protein EHM58_16360 [Ignavibacteriae bacterium]|nr:MAG: hypothetical protein EHM58_16360 [Ignavibacteriota bacterium]